MHCCSLEGVVIWVWATMSDTQLRCFALQAAASLWHISTGCCCTRRCSVKVCCKVYYLQRGGWRRFLSGHNSSCNNRGGVLLRLFVGGVLTSLPPSHVLSLREVPAALNCQKNWFHDTTFMTNHVVLRKNWVFQASRLACGPNLARYVREQVLIRQSSRAGSTLLTTLCKMRTRESQLSALPNFI